MSLPLHVGVGIGRCMAARGEDATMLKGDRHSNQQHPAAALLLEYVDS